MKTKLVTLGIAVSIIAAIGGIATLATTTSVQAQGIDRDNPICESGSQANIHAEDSTDFSGSGNQINSCRG